MIELLERRKEAAASGELPAYAFGDEEKALLAEFKLRYGNLYLVQHLQNKGGDFSNIVDLYQRNKATIALYEQGMSGARLEIEDEVKRLNGLRKDAAAGTIGNQIGTALANHLPSAVSNAIFGAVPALTPSAPLTNAQEIQLQDQLFRTTGRLAQAEKSLQEAKRLDRTYSLLLRSAIEPSNAKLVENFYKQTYADRHGSKPSDALVQDTLSAIYRVVPREVLLD